MTVKPVLYLSYDGLLEPLGSSQVVPVVEGLAGQGFPLTVVSFEKPRDLSRAEAVSELRNRLAGAEIRWFPRRYHARPSLSATAYDVWAGSRLARRILKEARGNALIHARSYVAGLMGLRSMKGFRRGGGEETTGPRLLFDMRGFWVDERLEAGRWKADSPVVALARRAERTLLQEADWVVHLTRAGMERAPELAPDSSLPPASVIPTCVDTDRFRPPEDRLALRRELGLGSGPVFIHTGTLSGWYLGTETFRLARALVERTGGEFVVLTREGDLARALAEEEGIRARIDTVPFQEVPRWLGAADVGLSLVRPGFAKSASAPTKIGEYLASGLVVVGTRGVGDLEDQFRGSAVALAMGQDADPEGVSDWVMAALARPAREAESRELARRYYDLREGIQAYAGIYRELGGLK